VVEAPVEMVVLLQGKLDLRELIALAAAVVVEELVLQQMV
jgi:hypothetical protein